MASLLLLTSLLLLLSPPVLTTLLLLVSPAVPFVSFKSFAAVEPTVDVFIPLLSLPWPAFPIADKVSSATGVSNVLGGPCYCWCLCCCCLPAVVGIPDVADFPAVADDSVVAVAVPLL